MSSINCRFDQAGGRPGPTPTGNKGLQPGPLLIRQITTPHKVMITDLEPLLKQTLIYF